MKPLFEMMDGATVLVGVRNVIPPSGDSMRCVQRNVAFIPTGFTGNLIEGVCAFTGEDLVFTKTELLSGEFQPFRMEEALERGRKAVQHRRPKS